MEVAEDGVSLHLVVAIRQALVLRETQMNLTTSHRPDAGHEQDLQHKETEAHDGGRREGVLWRESVVEGRTGRRDGGDGDACTPVGGACKTDEKGAKFHT